MAVDDDVAAALEPLEHDGWISRVVREIKSGKEATVYCCAPGSRALDDAVRTQWRGDRAHGHDAAASMTALTPHSSPGGRGEPLLAAKVYRPIKHRGFKNDAIYTTGRLHLVRSGRAQRAAQAHSAFGREVQMGTWIDQEWSVMRALHDAGADVPRPLARAERVILMPFIGNADGPAPNLNDADLSRTEAERATDALLANVALMLDRDVVHGDLSAFNVLYWNGRAVIIDLPQAVDPRLNPAAQTLLARDVENICTWAARRGVRRDARAIARDLWRRFRIGEIG